MWTNISYLPGYRWCTEFFFIENLFQIISWGGSCIEGAFLANFAQQVLTLCF